MRKYSKKSERDAAVKKLLGFGGSLSISEAAKEHGCHPNTMAAWARKARRPRQPAVRNALVALPTLPRAVVTEADIDNQIRTSLSLKVARRDTQRAELKTLEDQIARYSLVVEQLGESDNDQQAVANV